MKSHSSSSKPVAQQNRKCEHIKLQGEHRPGTLGCVQAKMAALSVKAWPSPQPVQALKYEGEGRALSSTHGLNSFLVKESLGFPKVYS